MTQPHCCIKFGNKMFKLTTLGFHHSSDSVLHCCVFFRLTIFQSPMVTAVKFPFIQERNIRKMPASLSASRKYCQRNVDADNSLCRLLKVCNKGELKPLYIVDF